MADTRKNYFDDKGNYINVENLSLREIYERGFDEGFKRGYLEGALHNKEMTPSEYADLYFAKLMGGNFT